MNYLNESLAHESGLELDDFYTDNNLIKADIQFECSQCGIVSTDFTNIECDENIWGLCSSCKEYCMLFDLSKEA